MCIGGAKTPKVPKALPKPKTDEGAVAARKSRETASDQRGVFANIFTSALGDTGYGKNVE